MSAQQSDGRVAGELFPLTARNINFKLSVRDNQGGYNTQDIAVQTVDTESGKRFAITQNTAITRNTAATITWNVANTNTAPINCDSVDIHLSNDRGLTFPYTLASQTPNDGSEAVQYPDVELGANARLRLSCSNSIFYYVTRSANATASDADTLTSTNSYYANNSSSNNSSSDNSDSGSGLLSPYWLFVLLVTVSLRRKNTFAHK